MLRIIIFIGIIALAMAGALLFHPADLLWLGIAFAIAMVLRLAGEKWARPAGAVFLGGLCYLAAFAWLSPIRQGLLLYPIAEICLWVISCLLLFITIPALLLALKRGFFKDFSREFVWVWFLALGFLIIAIVMNLILTQKPQPVPLLLGIFALLVFVGMRWLPDAAKGWFIPILVILIIVLGGYRMLHGESSKSRIWEETKGRHDDEKLLPELKIVEMLIPYDRDFKLELAEYCIQTGELDEAGQALARAHLLPGDEGRYDAITSVLILRRSDWGMARLYQDMTVNMDCHGKSDLWQETATRLGLDLVTIRALSSIQSEQWSEAAEALESKTAPNQALLVGKLYLEGNQQQKAQERLQVVAARDDLDGMTARLALGQKVPGSRFIPWKDTVREGGMEVYQGWNISTDGVSTELELVPDERVWIMALGWAARGIWPVMDVWVDGELAQQIYVEGHLFWPYLLNPIPAGRHAIKLSFANDISVEGSIDRNLTLDGIYIVKMAQ